MFISERPGADMKTIKILAVLTAVIFIISGCSGKKYDITVTAGGNKAALDGLEKTLASFTAKTRIKVKLTRAADPLIAKDMVTSQVMNKQSGADVLITDTCYVQAMAAGNILEDLSHDFSGLEPEFPGNISAACKRNGGIYAVPVAFDAYVIYCLLEPFKKAGVLPPVQISGILPSLSSVASYHRKINKRWMEGPFISYSAAGTEALTETFLALSGGVEINDGRINASSAPQKNTIDTMKAFSAAKKNFEMEKLNSWFLAADFMQARSLLMIAPVSIQSELKAENSPVKGKYTVLKMPGGKTIATGIGAGIPLNSQAKAKAKKLLAYLMSSEGQVQLALNCGYMPSIKSAAQDSQVVAMYPHASWYYEYAVTAPAKPVLSNYQYVSERLREAIQYSVSGAKSFKEAFSTVSDEVTAAR